MYNGYHPRATGVTGEPAQHVLGGEKQQVTDNLHGRHYVDALRGRVFSQATTPLGLAIPIYTATALGGGALPVWNPPGSGVNIELITFDTVRASGTAAFAVVGLMIRELNAIATGEIMTALAETAPDNGLFGGGNSVKSKSSNAGTNTVTAGAAGDWVRSMFGINLEADTGTAQPTHAAQHDFRGTVIIPPGYLAYFAATKASVALYASTVVWKEVPV